MPSVIIVTDGSIEYMSPDQTKSDTEPPRFLEVAYANLETFRRHWYGPPRLVVIGNFNVGKSSLINALLGKIVLPYGLKPVTGTVIRLVHGSEDETTVHFINGRTQTEPGHTLLEEYGVIQTSKDAEPIRSICVTCSSPFLQDGITVVDVPGLVHERHYYETVLREILFADLVLSVHDVTQQMTHTEMCFLQDLIENGIHSISIILNKGNLMDDEERTAALNGVITQINQLRYFPPDPLRRWYQLDVLPELRQQLSGKPVSLSFLTFQGDLRQALNDTVSLRKQRVGKLETVTQHHTAKYGYVIPRRTVPHTTITDTHPVNIVQFFDNTRLITAGDTGRGIHIWNLETRQLERKINIPGQIEALALDPSGGTIACATEVGDIHLIRADHLETFGLPTHHTGPVFSLAYDRYCRLASAGWDSIVAIWYDNSPPVNLVGHCSAVYALAFSPDGRRLASAGADGTICLWDMFNGALLQTLGGEGVAISSLAFNAKGTILAAGDLKGDLYFWCPKTGRQLRTLPKQASSITMVQFSPKDSLLLAFGTQDGSVGTWTPGLNAPRICSFSHNAIRSIAFSPDGRQIAVTDGQAIVRIWKSDHT